MWETRKQPQVQVSRIHPNHPKWFREVLIFCWGGTGWNCETLHKQKHQDVSLAKHLAQNPWRSTSPKVRNFLQKKKLRFSGHSFYLHPETFGEMIQILEEQTFQRETWSHQLVLYTFSCGEKSPHCWKVFSKVTKLWQFNNNDRVPTDVVSWWPKIWCLMQI